ncbi:MAG: hypothetical protein WD490_06950 [Opitutales bacterium]
MNLSSAIKSPWPLGILITSLLCPLGFADQEAELGKDEVFVDFRAWVDAYLAADEDARGGMVAEGRRLAETRRLRLAKLMEKKPHDAVDLMMPAAERESLPASVREEIERPLKGEGILRAVISDDFERGASRTDYTLYFEGRRYHAFLSLKKNRVLLNRPLCLKGFILGGRALLTELTPVS